MFNSEQVLKNKYEVMSWYVFVAANEEEGEEEEEDANTRPRRHVVMLNCGGTVDVVDFLDPPDDVVIFVADSHRPTDVCNIYSDGQVRLLMKPDDEEGKAAAASFQKQQIWPFILQGHFRRWTPAAYS